MNQLELLNYIRSECAKGAPKEQITAHLSGTGYPVSEIEKAFVAFEKNPSITATGGAVLKRHHPFRLFVAILACLSALLGLLGVLVSEGIVSLPIPEIPFDLPFSVDTQTLAPTISTPALPPADHQAPSLAAGQAASGGLSASNGVSSDDKVQIIDALLTQDNILRSKDAPRVRNYLRVIAPAADQTKVSTMSDSAVLVYAAGLLGGTGTVGAGVLDSSQVTWQRTSGSTVAVNIPVNGGFVTRTSTELNGVWY